MQSATVRFLAFALLHIQVSGNGVVSACFSVSMNWFDVLSVSSPYLDCYSHSDNAASSNSIA